MERVCKTCKKIYTKPDYLSKNRFKKRIYCSVICRSHDPETKAKFIEMISVPFSEERKKKHSTFFKKGEESHRWIKDRSKLKVSKKKHLCTKYKYWMISVKKRDGWKCKIDKNCSGRLEAHHIYRWNDYPDLRYEINNGITLCKKHHPIKKSEEIKLIDKFKQLIKNNHE